MEKFYYYFFNLQITIIMKKNMMSKKILPGLLRTLVVAVHRTWCSILKCRNPEPKDFLKLQGKHGSGALRIQAPAPGPCWNNFNTFVFLQIKMWLSPDSYHQLHLMKRMFSNNYTCFLEKKAQPWSSLTKHQLT